MAIEFKEMTLLTDDVLRLRAFYETVFQLPSTMRICP